MGNLTEEHPKQVPPLYSGEFVQARRGIKEEVSVHKCRCGDSLTITTTTDDGVATLITEGCVRCNYAHMLLAPNALWKALR